MSNRLSIEIDKKKSEKDFFIEVNMDVCWWASLETDTILELAYILSEKAIIVWNNYIFQGELADKLNSLKSLPANALHAIGNAINEKEERMNDLHLNKFFRSFVTPVIQFQDGDLNIPYEVKSAFLSVFYILKGMLSVRNPFIATHCFSSSITRSFDAIKISNVFTNKEISMLTQKYLLLSAKR